MKHIIAAALIAVGIFGLELPALAFEAQVSAVGKDNVVVSSPSAAQQVKAGQILRSGPLSFEVKEIDGDLLVLHTASLAGITVGQKFDINFPDASQKADELLKKHESAAAADPASPPPAPPQSPEPVHNDKYVGFLLGDGISTTSGHSGNFFVAGARIGADLFEGDRGIFSLGLNFETESDSKQIGLVKAEAQLYAYQAEILSRKLFGSPFYLGIRSGIAVEHLKITAVGYTLGEGNGSTFLINPMVGAEFRLSKNAAANVDLSWIHAGSGSVDTGIATFPLSASSAVLIQAGVLFDWH